MHLFIHMLSFLQMFSMSTKFVKQKKMIKTWLKQKTANPYFKVGGVDTASVSFFKCALIFISSAASRGRQCHPHQAALLLFSQFLIKCQQSLN